MAPRWLLVTAVALALVFLLFPGIDLWASRLLYGAESGFVLKGNVLFAHVHKYINYVPYALVLGSLFLWLPHGFAFAPQKLRRWRPVALFLVLVLALGPGLLANGLFKNQWGRARPGHLEEFGGTAHFTPAWVISDQCRKNCSFVCGDCSVGFTLVALAFVSRRSRLWFGLGVAAGGAIGLMRMGQGGHFLSDVIFAFFTVYFAAWLVHRWMTREGRPLVPP
jgi:lipid A 4'-phosphatase